MRRVGCRRLLKRLSRMLFSMSIVEVASAGKGGKSSSGLNITITPSPPPGVGDKLLMLAGWAVWAIGLASAVVMVYGVFKVTQGDRREGTMYIVGGAIGLAVAASINSLISSITS